MATVVEKINTLVESTKTPMFNNGRVNAKFTFFAKPAISNDRTFLAGKVEGYRCVIEPVTGKAGRAKADFEKLAHKLGVEDFIVFGQKPYVNAQGEMLVMCDTTVDTAQFSIIDYNELRGLMLRSDDEEEKVIGQIFDAKASADMLRSWSDAHPRTVAEDAQPKRRSLL